ncbi:hypothetical protein DM877_03650 [Enterobacter cloacae]|uniref:Uncharacterized protein n=1 Tax=Enterobacter cloacae TaxID=550 RepID=A0A4Q2EG07_ENTCL|nr:hypothetical protein DM877_03650 [Enterobacter cloacae]
MKRDAYELHKVACRFARRLPEGHCRVAATPYPAYKTVNLPATRTVGPRKRSAAGHSLHRRNSLRRPFHFEQHFQ